MKFKNVYFINGTAYAGKSTMVKLLAEACGGIACQENYHDALLGQLSRDEFPCLTYSRDLKDWREFVRRSPGEYEAWITGCIRECTVLELQILRRLDREGRPVFVDTNIPVEVLKEVSDRDHVLIMLADPEISVNRFFDRPDREKQFLYRLLQEEDNAGQAMENFRQCLKRINSEENYRKFLNSGFPVILRDERRSVQQTLRLAQRLFKLPQDGAAR